MTIEQGLAASAIGAELSEMELHRLASIAELVEFAAGEVIVRQHEVAQDLFVVMEGKAIITAGNGDPVARIKPGHAFGEMALIDCKPRSATVTAETDVRLIKLSGEALAQLFEDNCQLSIRILRTIGRMLCERLRSANQQIEALLLVSGFE